MHPAVPYFAWPRSSRDSDGYCSCLVLPGHFQTCSNNCGPSYHFALEGSSVCLRNSSIGTDLLRVYFIDESHACSDRSCFMTHINAAYSLVQERKWYTRGTSDKGPSEKRTQYKSPLYKGHYIHGPKNVHFPIVLVATFLTSKERTTSLTKDWSQCVLYPEVLLYYTIWFIKALYL